MSTSKTSRRNFLKLGVSGAVVVVIAGVGSYLMLQAPPALTPPAPAAPAATPKPAPAVPVTPSPIPAPAATSSPIPSPAVTPTPSPTLVDKANQEGAVMVYSNWDEASVNAYLKPFMQKYPKIKAEAIRGYVELQERTVTEARAGKHVNDVWIGSLTNTLYLHNEDLIAQYVSPELSAYTEKEKSKPEGLYTIVAQVVQCIAYNTEKVKGADIPTSYWDLLKPRFKGVIGVWNPYSAAIQLLVGKKVIIGEARWKEYLTGLRDQGAREFRAFGEMMTQLKIGEVEILQWSYTGSLMPMIRQGAPVEFVRRKGTLVGNEGTVWINRYAPHPNAARLLMDFMLSEQGASSVSDLGVYVMTRKGLQSKVGLGIGTGELVTYDMLATTPYTLKDLQDAVAEYRTLFIR